MILQFKPDIITDFLQWMQELGYYIYLHLTLSDELSEAASSFGFKATGDQMLPERHALVKDDQ